MIQKNEVYDFLKRGRDLRYQYTTIDASNKCTLLCSGCKRQANKFFGFHPGENGGKDMPFEHFKKLADYFNAFTFCGQVSDPIFCPDLIKMLRYLSDREDQKYWLSVHTAATNKSRQKEWYEEAFLANTKANWIFGIDGLPEESHLYRTGQDGVFLFEMMKLAKKMGLEPRWQYIVFKYNEDHIEKCLQIAKDEGITFELNITSKWPEGQKPTREEYVKDFRWQEFE
jgi:MoaA/NifB/PqqE/SkfB family radical SAM enzyme